MKIKDDQLFQQLKKEIVATMQQSYPGISGDITKWKGREIADFQDELLRKVNEHISEKWFYTHMKAQYPTLPRIDILNFLSRFAGYRNWDDFKHAKRKKKGKLSGLLTPGKYFILIPLLTILILVVFYFAYHSYSTRSYRFCFYDLKTGKPIENTIIELRFLDTDQFPKTLYSDGNGCLTLRTDLSSIKFEVKAPYYFTDTISMKLDRSKMERRVMMQANNYAMLIHLFSKKTVNERQERRDRMDELISDDALIFQESDEDPKGIEMFSKQEFIDLLTLPAVDEKHIEVLETKLRDKKIIILRFKFVEDNHQ